MRPVLHDVAVPVRAGFHKALPALALATLLMLPLPAWTQQPSPSGGSTPPAAAATTPPAAEYEPRVGQSGKDVVWVPTPQSLVDKMLDMAKVTPADFVMDLGSGDGRLVITAAQRGARALGIEYNPDMVALSRRNAEKEGMSERAKFDKADIFETDFSKATVITLFLLTDLNLKLRPKLLELAPGTRVVSNAWKMGDWEPEEQARVQDCNAWCTAYLWIVPAKAGGRWMLGKRPLELKQTFQMVEGTLGSGKSAQMVKGRILGDQIKFSVGKTQYTGRIAGDVIEGGTGKNAWKATRAPAGK